MNTIETIKSRRSIRKYKENIKIPREQIMKAMPYTQMLKTASIAIVLPNARRDGKNFPSPLSFSIDSSRMSALCFSFRKNDLINREIDHHLHAAVDHGDEHIVDRRREKTFAQRHIQPMPPVTGQLNT